MNTPFTKQDTVSETKKLKILKEGGDATVFLEELGRTAVHDRESIEEAAAVSGVLLYSVPEGSQLADGQECLGAFSWGSLNFVETLLLYPSCLVHVGVPRTKPLRSCWAVPYGELTEAGANKFTYEGYPVPFIDKTAAKHLRKSIGVAFKAAANTEQGKGKKIAIGCVAFVLIFFMIPMCVGTTQTSSPAASSSAATSQEEVRDAAFLESEKVKVEARIAKTIVSCERMQQTLIHKAETTAYSKAYLMENYSGQMLNRARSNIGDKATRDNINYWASNIYEEPEFWRMKKQIVAFSTVCSSTVPLYAELQALDTEIHEWKLVNDADYKAKWDKQRAQEAYQSELDAAIKSLGLIDLSKHILAEIDAKPDHWNNKMTKDYALKQAYAFMSIYSDETMYYRSIYKEKRGSAFKNDETWEWYCQACDSKQVEEILIFINQIDKLMISKPVFNEKVPNPKFEHRFWTFVIAERERILNKKRLEVEAKKMEAKHKAYHERLKTKVDTILANSRGPRPRNGGFRKVSISLVRKASEIVVKELEATENQVYWDNQSKQIGYYAYKLSEYYGYWLRGLDFNFMDKTPDRAINRAPWEKACLAISLEDIEHVKFILNNQLNKESFLRRLDSQFRHAEEYINLQLWDEVKSVISP